MSRAEKFIQDYTRNCSNLVYKDTINGKEFNTYNEWLTPDDARKAVEIAREEVIERMVEFLSKEENIPLWDDNSGNFGCDNLLLIKKLKQAMKNE